MKSNLSDHSNAYIHVKRYVAILGTGTFSLIQTTTGQYIAFAFINYAPFTIVLRNEDTSTQATSELTKCKH